jgi:hypothetical protein
MAITATNAMAAKTICGNAPDPRFSNREVGMPDATKNNPNEASNRAI